jgi:predicted outer membrane repeat protein
VNIIFKDNIAVNGAGLTCFSSSPTVIGCTFFNNTSELTGGAIRCSDDASPHFIGCTLAYNDCPQVGSGVFCENNASPIFENCIIAFNGNSESFYCMTGGQPTLTCCDVYGNLGGDWVGCIEDQIWINGNIWEDPLFCDPGTENYRLEDNSPCAPFSPPNAECDLIGAWPAGCNPSSVGDGGIDPLAVRLGISSPNPFGHTTRLSYVIPDGMTAEPVLLRIFDASGRLVRTLVDGPQHAGVHTVRWDGRNTAGETLANGLFFYRLTRDGVSRSRSVMLLR